MNPAPAPAPDDSTDDSTTDDSTTEDDSTDDSTTEDDSTDDTPDDALPGTSSTADSLLPAALTRRTDALWQRHANPKSGWSRVATLPVLMYGIYTRRPRLVAAALGFVVVNPVLFSPPDDADAWMTRVVLGERMYYRHREERGAVEGTDKSHRWIVDPLDGTLNFMHAQPHFAISIALEREGELVAGVGGPAAENVVAVGAQRAYPPHQRGNTCCQLGQADILAEVVIGAEAKGLRDGNGIRAVGDEILRGSEDEVETLTTVSTPHRGSAIAARVIEQYYSRIEAANLLFSAYKEGWKTDRGMVYVVLGPPMRIEWTAEGERWHYSYNTSDPREVFYFNRVRGQGRQDVIDQYVLERHAYYSTTWRRAAATETAGTLP